MNTKEILTGIKTWVLSKIVYATQTTPGYIQPRHTGETNKSGLLITDEEGSLQVNTREDLGLRIDGVGQLHAVVKRSATDADIAKIGTAEASGEAAVTMSNIGKAGVAAGLLNAISMPYSNVKSLRDLGALVPGAYYRITDYVTTTTQADTQSAGHQFDVIVRADSVSKLNEQAWAIRHDGDTYFANAKLEAWKLKYSLDNDINRFAWADAENGKGVIFEMEDEWGNRCPYDFKNIMFKRCYCEPDVFENEGRYLAIPGMMVGPGSEALPAQNDSDYIYVYTFSCLASLDEDPRAHPAQADASMGLFLTESEMMADYGDSPRPANNIMDPYYVSQSIDDEPLRKVQALQNITFQQFFTDEYSYHCSENHISGSCHDWSCRSKNFHNNEFSEAKVEYCYFSGNVGYNTFSGNIYNDTFSGSLWYNTFSGNIYNNTFSGNIYNNTFSGNIYNDTFSGDIYQCTFSGYIYNNTFSGECYDCTFSGYTENCTFSGYTENCTFSGDVSYNTFSGECYDCTFSGYIYNNTFSGDVKYCLFKGYTYYADFVYTGTMQHVTVCGQIEGTSSNHERISVQGNKNYEQVVTVDDSNAVVVLTPYI